MLQPLKSREQIACGKPVSYIAYIHTILPVWYAYSHAQLDVECNADCIKLKISMPKEAALVQKVRQMSSK